MAKDAAGGITGRAFSVGLAEQFAYDIGGLLIGPRGSMGVDLHRGGAVGVAESCGHGRHWHAGVEELGGLEVAEVV